MVTGGNRGIGFEVCRQLAQKGLRVVLTSRVTKDGEPAARRLREEEDLDVEYARLDVSSERSIRECADLLRDQDVHVDALINNAAICPSGTVLELEAQTMVEGLRTNLLGPFWICRAFVPRMLQAGYGRVVNVSSGWGAFAQGLGGPVAYSVPKAALNALTVSLANEVRGDIKVNAVCPGWVRTRMGGAEATRTVERGAETIVWLATLPTRGPNGGFFRDKKRIDW